jgi:hypothetical protein
LLLAIRILRIRQSFQTIQPCEFSTSSFLLGLRVALRFGEESLRCGGRLRYCAPSRQCIRARRTIPHLLDLLQILLLEFHDRRGLHVRDDQGVVRVGVGQEFLLETPCFRSGRLQIRYVHSLIILLVDRPQDDLLRLGLDRDEVVVVRVGQVANAELKVSRGVQTDEEGLQSTERRARSIHHTLSN